MGQQQSRHTMEVIKQLPDPVLLMVRIRNREAATNQSQREQNSKAAVIANQSSPSQAVTTNVHGSKPMAVVGPEARKSRCQ